MEALLHTTKEIWGVIRKRNTLITSPPPRS
jgi:hypothetical protein